MLWFCLSEDGWIDKSCQYGGIPSSNFDNTRVLQEHVWHGGIFRQLQGPERPPGCCSHGTECHLRSAPGSGGHGCSIHPSPPGGLSICGGSPSPLESLVSTVVGPFCWFCCPFWSDYRFGFSTPCGSCLLWLLLLSLTTNSSVTVTSGTPLHSVYLLQNPVPSFPTTQAPVPAAPVTQLRDEPASTSPGTLNTPRVPNQTFQTYHPPSPAASTTLFYSSPSNQISAPPATVACPDSTSAQTGIVHLQQSYTTFGSLFPVNQFSNLSYHADFDTHSFLVHSFLWATKVLRGMIRENPFPILLDPADQVGRAVLMATPLWPGNEHTAASSLHDLLAAMIPIYAQLLTRGSFTYWIGRWNFQRYCVFVCCFFEPRGWTFPHVYYWTEMRKWTLAHLNLIIRLTITICYCQQL